MIHCLGCAGPLPRSFPLLHIPGNNIVKALSLLEKHVHYSTLHALWTLDSRPIVTQL